MSYEYFNTLNDESRTRYLKRLEFAKLKEYPYRFPADTWKDNPTLWPELEYSEIYDYLINTPGVYTKKVMESRKSFEAHNQFVSGWVGVFKLMQTEESTYLLTATVLHSQALSDDPLQLWVALQKCGSVICAHCNCMAG